MYEMFEFLHGAPYAFCVELKYFYFFVFCLFRVCLGRGSRVGGVVWMFV